MICDAISMYLMVHYGTLHVVRELVEQKNENACRVSLRPGSATDFSATLNATENSVSTWSNYMVPT